MKGAIDNNDALGEREFIEVIRARLDEMPSLPVPFGDDISAINLNNKLTAVLKMDMLVAATDVPLGMNYWQAARKAVVMNVSDFAAKGALPLASLVSLGLPRGFPKEDVAAIASGLNAGAREYGAYIIGGDTNEASDVIISVFLFGKADRKRLMLRSGAKVGDIVAVSGVFGKSAAGLRILLNDLKVAEELRDELLGSVFMPIARLKEGLALAGSNAISASIDSSDGLAWSLNELMQASNVGFVLDRVPIADEVHRFAEFSGLDALDLALYGGEEYELVITVKPELWSEAVSALDGAGGKLLRIGEVVREKQVILRLDEKERIVEARGWEHFKTKI